MERLADFAAALPPDRSPLMQLKDLRIFLPFSRGVRVANCARAADRGTLRGFGKLVRGQGQACREAPAIVPNRDLRDLSLNYSNLCQNWAKAIGRPSELGVAK